MAVISGVFAQRMCSCLFAFRVAASTLVSEWTVSTSARYSTAVKLFLNCKSYEDTPPTQTPSSHVTRCRKRPASFTSLRGPVCSWHTLLFSSALHPSPSVRYIGAALAIFVLQMHQLFQPSTCAPTMPSTFSLFHAVNSLFSFKPHLDNSLPDANDQLSLYWFTMSPVDPWCT